MTLLYFRKQDDLRELNPRYLIGFDDFQEEMQLFFHKNIFELMAYYSYDLKEAVAFFKKIGILPNMLVKSFSTIIEENDVLIEIFVPTEMKIENFVFNREVCEKIICEVR